MEQLQATVFGRVQMVMYRDFATRKAQKYHLTGYVKNQKDGTVKVVAEGEPANLELYLKELEHGPLLASVSRVESMRVPATGTYQNFSIAYE